MNITLPEFIEKAGDKKAAELFGISERTAQAYRLGERTPRKGQAEKIVAATKRHRLGSVTYAGIYAGDRDQ